MRTREIEQVFKQVASSKGIDHATIQLLQAQQEQINDLKGDLTQVVQLLDQMADTVGNFGMALDGVKQHVNKERAEDDLGPSTQGLS
jgi:uncharacterized protein YoxC